MNKHQGSFRVPAWKQNPYWSETQYHYLDTKRTTSALSTLDRKMNLVGWYSRKRYKQKTIWMPPFMPPRTVCLWRNDWTLSATSSIKPDSVRSYQPCFQIQHFVTTLIPLYVKNIPRKIWHCAQWGQMLNTSLLDRNILKRRSWWTNGKNGLLVRMCQVAQRQYVRCI